MALVMPFMERRQEDQAARRRWNRARVAFWGQTVLVCVAIGWAWQNGQNAANDIQAQRVEAIRSSCVEQNARHDRLTVYIAALIARPQPGRTQLPKAERERQAAGFVNAIAPHRNCARVVSQLTR